MKTKRPEVAAGSPDPAILPAVRVQLQQAEEKLQTACKLLRENGWPENADSLSIEVKRLRVWTGKDGWISNLEK